MGLLVDGAWKEDVPRAKDGHFVRPATAFHNYITPDGSPGPTGKGGFPAEAGRYHLYVSLACPWASRALILRKLKKLEDVISVSVTKTHLGKAGGVWRRAGRDARQRQWQVDACGHLSPGRSAL
jgi:glutathionyl-hydroquinone reductase